MITVLTTLQTTIHDVTGIDETEISPEMHLEEDLGIPKQDLLRIITVCNHQFDTDVSIDTFFEEEFENQTLETLARMFQEEREL